MSDTEEPKLAWRKSTRSDSGGCVEVAAARGSILIRDSKHQDEPMLAFSPRAWSAFLERTRLADPGDHPV